MALDIFYLSNSNDKNSTSWLKLIERFPYARFVKRKDSIVDTYKECADKSYTTHFFVIPESLEVVDSFDFSLVNPVRSEKKQLYQVYSGLITFLENYDSKYRI
jgi:hypothetical protein